MLGGLARNATLLEISTDGQWSAWKKFEKSVVMRQSFHLFLTTLTMLISYCPIPLQMPGKLKCTSHRHWLVGLRGRIAHHHRSDIGRPFFRFKRRLVVLHIPHEGKAKSDCAQGETRPMEYHQPVQNKENLSSTQGLPK